MVDFLGYFEKHNIFVKTTLTIFGPLLELFGLLIIPLSGHTDCVVRYLISNDFEKTIFNS